MNGNTVGPFFSFFFFFYLIIVSSWFSSVIDLDLIHFDLIVTNASFLFIVWWESNLIDVNEVAISWNK